MPGRDRWREIQIEVAADAAEIVAAAATDVALGVELRDAGTVIRLAEPGRALVIAHVAPEERDALLEVVESAAESTRAAGGTIDPVVIRERDAHEDEWRDVWKQFFKATRIGRSFVVRPSWDPGAIAAGDRVIDLDPGRAFGTGGHASTRLEIEAMEDLAASPAGATVTRFLDLGCGSGILSIAAARLWPHAAGLAVDVDPEATACAGENFARNDVRSVERLTGSLQALPVGARFDLILANIQADVLADLAPQFPARLVAGGRAILSGLLLRDADPVLSCFRDVGFEHLRRRDEGEWASLDLRLVGAPPRGKDRAAAVR